jgi:hypothetical protein
MACKVVAPSTPWTKTCPWGPRLSTPAGGRADFRVLLPGYSISLIRHNSKVQWTGETEAGIIDPILSLRLAIENEVIVFAGDRDGHMISLVLQLSHLLPDTAWATYTYILVSYHLVLAIKVFTADKKAGMSFPLGQTILTHLACLALLIGLAVSRHQIPFFGIIRFFIPGLAPFEAEWLFTGGRVKTERINDEEAFQAAAVRVESAPDGAVPVAPAQVSLYDSSTGEEYNEFLSLMQQGKRPFRKPGISVKDEYELWLADRAKKGRATTLSANPST